MGLLLIFIMLMWDFVVSAEAGSTALTSGQVVKQYVRLNSLREGIIDMPVALAGHGLASVLLVIGQAAEPRYIAERKVFKERGGLR